ncbi:unnamed protein product [Mytilus coruscus]|uniref:Uncharacterized protein n=1 Tax=Mytilus coruscus TaxID=42192 RepID=A0A6J8BAL2_MYTCO|nr:unnamed protein product [Mytilus coruscus]
MKEETRGVDKAIELNTQPPQQVSFSTLSTTPVLSRQYIVNRPSLTIYSSPSNLGCSNFTGSIVCITNESATPVYTSSVTQWNESGTAKRTSPSLAQTAHWSYDQVTLNPVASYCNCHLEGCSDIVEESIVFISDDHKHDNNVVQHFFKTAVNHLLAKGVEIEKLIHFSDFQMVHPLNTREKVVSSSMDISNTLLYGILKSSTAKKCAKNINFILLRELIVTAWMVCRRLKEAILVTVRVVLKFGNVNQLQKYETGENDNPKDAECIAAIDCDDGTIHRHSDYCRQNHNVTCDNNKILGFSFGNHLESSKECQRQGSFIKWYPDDFCSFNKIAHPLWTSGRRQKHIFHQYKSCKCCIKQISNLF